MSEKTLVIPISIEETESFKIIDELKDPVISIADNPIKNTKDYHIIMNSKTEFMERALSLTQDRILAWVDFGVGNVISQDNSFKKIDSIDKFSWEVNIWSIMEHDYNFPFIWYKGDHNDTIFNFLDKKDV